MIWEWMNCVTENLNPDALMRCRNTIGELSVWMQALLFGMLVLLAGCCLVECLFGLRMKEFPRFLTGFAIAYCVCFVLLYQRLELNEMGLVLYPALAGVTGALMYTYLEHGFRFVTGFAFGLALATWLLPLWFSMDVSEHPGRIWRVAAAAAVGVIFAVLTNRGRILLSALTGAAVLALLAETFIPYDRIPYLSDRLGLDEGMYRNALAAVLAAVGILIQGIQFLVLDRKRKAEEAAAARREEQEAAERERRAEPDAEGNDREADAPAGQDPAEEVSMADAEAVLVEKARELAAAAARRSQMARLQDRYADVAEGLYGAEVAARKLGMTQEAFLDGMRSSGYLLPEDPAEEPSADSEIPEEETAAEETTAEETTAEESAADPEVSPSETGADTEAAAQAPEAEGAAAEKPAADPEISAEETALVTEEETDGRGCKDGTVREESADLPETGQGDLGEDQGGAE